MRLVYSWLLLALPASAGEARFRDHFIDKTLPQNDRLQGDYGLTALTDLARDGDLDFVLGGPPASAGRAVLMWMATAGVIPLAVACGFATPASPPVEIRGIN